jgi:hypothetical protein
MRIYRLLAKLGKNPSAATWSSWLGQLIHTLLNSSQHTGVSHPRHNMACCARYTEAFTNLPRRNRLLLFLHIRKYALPGLWNCISGVFCLPPMPE